MSHEIEIGTKVTTPIGKCPGVVQGIQACNRTGKLYYDVRWENGVIARSLADYEFSVPVIDAALELRRKRSELRKLAWVLTYKSDIYSPLGRIYGFEAKFTVTKDGKLMHGDKELDPATLTDGNGARITSDSNL